eukprot:TRINITY_DN21873_c0_g1_i1.p1 TRINITY_DN21873_c0_g1~~TRINITY_DN21873_c0_g1_i1.p1  ORF type:complete len:396 (+),score=53.21 TRINITY_DN21873_c0_g1_i1:177-1364(+)
METSAHRSPVWLEGAKHEGAADGVRPAVNVAVIAQTVFEGIFGTRSRQGLYSRGSFDTLVDTTMLLVPFLVACVAVASLLVGGALRLKKGQSSEEEGEEAASRVLPSPRLAAVGESKRWTICRPKALDFDSERPEALGNASRPGCDVLPHVVVAPKTPSPPRSPALEQHRPPALTSLSPASPVATQTQQAVQAQRPLLDAGALTSRLARSTMVMAASDAPSCHADLRAPMPEALTRTTTGSSEGGRSLLEAGGWPSAPSRPSCSRLPRRSALKGSRPTPLFPKKVTFAASLVDYPPMPRKPRFASSPRAPEHAPPAWALTTTVRRRASPPSQGTVATQPPTLDDAEASLWPGQTAGLLSHGLHSCSIEVAVQGPGQGEVSMPLPPGGVGEWLAVR